MILGHEGAGVWETGPGVKSPAEGDHGESRSISRMYA